MVNLSFTEKTQACFRKKMFITYEEAETACRRIKIPMRIYQCPTCQGYHLTSRVKPAKEKKC